MIRALKQAGLFVGRALLDVFQTDGKISYWKIGWAIAAFGLHSWLISWKFAVFVMITIGWHESGHVWAMRRVGVGSKGFFWIPFVGGVSLISGECTSLYEKVIIGIMGPIWGLLLAAATMVVYLITGNPYVGVAAFWGAGVNLFNLIPANPLDGGQIARACFSSIDRRLANAFAFCSILAFGCLWWMLKSPIFILLGYYSIRDFWLHYKVNPDAELHKITGRDLGYVALSYVVLIGLLGSIMLATHSAGSINLFLHK